MSNNTQPRQPKGVPVGGQWSATRRPEGKVDLDKGPKVTRSPGTIVSIGGTSGIVGGGYRGLTPELDQTVEGAGSALAEHFGTDVEVRFNSDRRSGGAWLVTHPGEKGTSANTWVGINARQARTRAEAEADERLRAAFDYEEGEWQGYLASCDGQVHIEVLVRGEALRDLSLANEEGDPGGRRKFWREVPDVASAVELVEKVSIAGDPAELARRRAVAEHFGQEQAALRTKAEKRFTKAARPLEYLERANLRQEMLAAYEGSRAELVERFWEEIQGAPEAAGSTLSGD